MIMKRLLSMILALAVLCLISGCQIGNDTEIPPTLEKGAFWTDDTILIIQSEDEIDAETLKSHCENEGIIAVFSPELASAVQDTLKPNVSVSISGNEKAFLFYINKYGTYSSYFLESNATSIDSEVDDMVKTIKTTRQ